MGWVHMHVNKCARADVSLFRILEAAVRIALKFGTWLGTHYLGVLQKLRVGWAQLYVSTCATVFRISETSERTALKFGMWLETEARGYSCTCACTHPFYEYRERQDGLR